MGRKGLEVELQPYWYKYWMDKHAGIGKTMNLVSWFPRDQLNSVSLRRAARYRG
jgi:hypothetical protein